LGLRERLFKQLRGQRAGPDAFSPRRLPDRKYDVGWQMPADGDEAFSLSHRDQIISSTKSLRDPRTQFSTRDRTVKKR
jgi:hypothetical protein